MQSVFPQTLFIVGGIAIRDTVVWTWVMMALIMALAVLIRHLQPGALEVLIDFFTDMISTVMQRPGGPYLPLLGSLAIFIGVANVIGVIPVISSPTHDINTALALALIVFFSVHFYGIQAKGLWGYLKGLASPIFTLPLEIIGQLSRTLSLTLRLFGNVISGELVVAVLFSLVPLFVPIPLVAFTMFTGVLQAYVFTVLAAIYVAAGVQASE